MKRLTKRERAAIRSALANLMAGEWDESVGENPGFDAEDAESALAKMQERDSATEG